MSLRTLNADLAKERITRLSKADSSDIVYGSDVDKQLALFDGIDEVRRSLKAYNTYSRTPASRAHTSQ